jgi:hypothetical protein
MLILESVNVSQHTRKISNNRIHSEYKKIKYGFTKPASDIEREIWGILPKEGEVESNIYSGFMELSSVNINKDTPEVLHRVTSYLLTEVERRIRTPQSTLFKFLKEAYNRSDEIQDKYDSVEEIPVDLINRNFLRVTFVADVKERDINVPGSSERESRKYLFTGIFDFDELCFLVEDVDYTDDFDIGKPGDSVAKGLAHLNVISLSQVDVLLEGPFEEENFKITQVRNLGFYFHD